MKAVWIFQHVPTPRVFRVTRLVDLLPAGAMLAVRRAVDEEARRGA